MTRRVLPLARVIDRLGPAPSRQSMMALNGVSIFGGATPGTGPTGSDGLDPVIAFCSDEDLARRAQADFAILAGDSQMLARGSDGSIGSDPWTFTTASVDLESQGVQDLDVIVIQPGRATNVQGASSYVAPRRLMAIESVSGHSAVLRGIGLAVGMGDPPTAPGGNGSIPLHFTVPTLYPQILDASYDLRRMYGLDDAIWGRRTNDLYELMQFTEPCVYKVLSARYLEMSRSAADGKGDDFVAKSKMYREELTSTLDRLAIHFKPTPIPQAEVTRFGCRLAR